MGTEKPLVKAYVNKENYEKIKVLAQKDKRSVSNLLEILIENYIKEYESENGEIKKEC